MNLRRIGVSSIKKIQMYAKYREARNGGDSADMAEIDYDGFMKKLFDAKDCHSMAKKYCTPEAAKKFKGVKTKLGGTLAHCIKPGRCFNI